MAVLEYKNIRKEFGAVIALKGVSLSLEAGEICALLGGNGSGKSTLAKITSGAVEPSSGEVWLNGSELKINSPYESHLRGISVTSQELSLFPSLTLIENLSIMNIPKKFGIFTDYKKAEESARNILKVVGLEHRADDRVQDLPDNEKYLVEFAKAILQEPKVLIVDEITSALRREEVAMVAGIMKDMAAKGCCILFISHRMNEIFDICSNVAVLRNGELINTYKIEDATMENLLTDMIGSDPFAGRETVESYYDESEVVMSVKNLQLSGFENSNVSFDLHKGEFLGIAGLQGQGQSQLLRRLYGMGKPTEYEYKGNPFVANSTQKCIDAGIGFLSGDRRTEGVFVGRPISENAVIVNDFVMRRPPADPVEVLAKNHVKYGKAEDNIETLSGGNQQKVVISRWSTVEPDVLLCDDPTKGIDVAARFDVHKMMRDMTAGGSAVVFVSSDDEELATIALTVPYYSVAIMYEGNIVKVLRGKDITVSNIISASMPLRGKQDK